MKIYLFMSVATIVVYQIFLILFPTATSVIHTTVKNKDICFNKAWMNITLKE